MSGSTQMAETIGETLREAGLEVDVRPAPDILDAPAAQVRAPAYDAVVWTADWKPVTGPGPVTSVRAWAARVAAELAAATPASRQEPPTSSA
jgi:hypothetical protein